MTTKEIKVFLETCEREELQDHAFGDSEVSWFKGGHFVADGYFGQSSAYIVATDGSWRLDGEDARSLRHVGRCRKIERNDVAGNERGA